MLNKASEIIIIFNDHAPWTLKKIHNVFHLLTLKIAPYLKPLCFTSDITLIWGVVSHPIVSLMKWTGLSHGNKGGVKEGQSRTSSGCHWRGRGGGAEAEKQMKTQRSRAGESSPLSVPAQLRSHFPCPQPSALCLTHSPLSNNYLLLNELSFKGSFGAILFFTSE